MGVLPPMLRSQALEPTPGLWVTTGEAEELFSSSLSENAPVDPYPGRAQRISERCFQPCLLLPRDVPYAHE
jgi:hypothetical protein